MNFKIHRVSEGKETNNSGENYSINTNLNLKARLLWEKVKHAIIS